MKTHASVKKLRKLNTNALSTGKSFDGTAPGLAFISLQLAEIMVNGLRCSASSAHR